MHTNKVNPWKPDIIPLSPLLHCCSGLHTDSEKLTITAILNHHMVQVAWGQAWGYYLHGNGVLIIPKVAQIGCATCAACRVYFSPRDRLHPQVVLHSCVQCITVQVKKNETLFLLVRCRS